MVEALFEGKGVKLGTKPMGYTTLLALALVAGAFTYLSVCGGRGALQRANKLEAAVF